MTSLLEQALRQVEQLPEGEQDAAAGALLDYVKHMHDTHLTEAQVAEVRRRKTDPNRKLLSHAEARERIGRLGS
jgi:hypothetical protein